MIRTRRLRSLVAMLLAFCLVSASLWSVSADALADALSVEPGFHNVDSDTNHAPAGKPCNEGCHAQSHLTGLDCGSAPAMLPAAEEAPRAEDRLAISARAPDGPFRPPRTTFRA